MRRRPLVGTGWKMNMNVAQARAYARALTPLLRELPTADIDLFVLPPFTSLHAAAEAFAGSPVAIGAQNMHWDSAGAWTGEISAPMLIEAGCRYVELGHSERLACFNESYAFVRRKVNAALSAGLSPILCLGEMEQDRRANQADLVLTQQAGEALTDAGAESVSEIVFAYEPRWAIGAAQAAPATYVADRHGALREFLRRRFGAGVADAARLMYGGSVTSASAEALVGLTDVDGLFVGRAAWSAEGFAEIIRIVLANAQQKEKL
jgi:triosephosphate isomerase